jgi:hypothetical protein
MGKMHHEENIFVCPGVWECGAKKDKTIIQKITDISAMRQELNRKLALLEIIKGGQSVLLYTKRIEAIKSSDRRGGK